MNCKTNLLLIPASLFFCITIFRVPVAFAQNIKEVVQKIDELYRADSSYTEVEMEIVTRHWKRTLRMKVWTEGKRNTFIRILSPPKEEGVATLRLGSEMWNYLPRANKVIKIPPSMMMSSWMGSDFTNDDLVKEFTLLDDYSYEFVKPQDARPELLYVEFTPKEGIPVVWGNIVAAVQREDYLPVWDRYYDDKGNLMRIIDFKDIKRLGGRRIPSVMEVVPQNKKDQKTVLRYLQAEFNVKLSDETFSLRNLQLR
jgi:outer membrane lipoprotein-sorting protein